MDVFKGANICIIEAGGVVGASPYKVLVVYFVMTLHAIINVLYSWILLDTIGYYWRTSFLKFLQKLDSPFEDGT